MRYVIYKWPLIALWDSVAFPTDAVSGGSLVLPGLVCLGNVTIIVQVKRLATLPGAGQQIFKVKSKKVFTAK